MEPKQPEPYQPEDFATAGGSIAALAAALKRREAARAVVKDSLITEDLPKVASGGSYL